MIDPTIQRETRSSIEIDMNAKGDWALKAKLYFDDTDSSGHMRAQRTLEAIDAWFQQRFRNSPVVVRTQTIVGS